MRLPRTLAVIAMTSAIVLTSCGGGSTSSASGVPASQWTANLCTTALNYSNAVKASESREIGPLLRNATSVGQAKAVLVKFLQSSVHLTDSAISNVQAKGAPAVDNGASIQTRVVKAFQSARSVLQRALAEVQNASTANPQAFSAAATTIGTAITSGFAQVQSAFVSIGQLDTSGELAKAGKANSTCRALSRQ